MTSTDFTPTPEPTEETEPFWQAGLRGELQLQRCDDCGYIRYPVSSICPECLSAKSTWTAMAGRGIVQSHITFDRAYHPSWADRVPYVVALIELDEGPVLLSNVVDTAPGEVRVGMHVVVTFVEKSEKAALPQFRPASGSGA